MSAAHLAPIPKICIAIRVCIYFQQINAARREICANKSFDANLRLLPAGFWFLFLLFVLSSVSSQIFVYSSRGFAFN